ncbi:MAG: polysaccharide pyruvyl transferase family protein [Lachnospiraceae bacterium]|nr:polysaccharide pyruvyl transferase family protein [Lachnospiraceae bacterium]
MKKKYLLIGEIYSTNLGDQLIAQCVGWAIDEKYNNVSLDMIDMSGRIPGGDYRIPVNLSDYITLIKFILRYGFRLIPGNWSKNKFFFNFKRYLKALLLLNDKLSSNSYDAVIFVGGALFQNYFAQLLYCMCDYISDFCENIVFHACGIGPLNHRSIKCLNDFVLNPSVKIISLRDGYDYFASHLSDEHKKIIKSFDTALNASRIFKTNSQKKGGVGLGIVDDPRLFLLQMYIAKTLYDRNIPFKLFTTGAVCDYQAGLAIIDLLSKNHEFDAILLERPDCVQQLIDDISSFECIISFRMHSLVIASSFGIPFTGIAYDQKVKEFMDKLDMDSYCFDIPNDLEADLQAFSTNIVSNRCVNFDSETISLVDKLGNQSINDLLYEINYCFCNNAGGI